VVYEALGYDPVRPYADFEKEFKTMEEMHANRDAELKRCIAELVELNGPLKNIVVLDSCGKKGDNFELAFHSGWFRCICKSRGCETRRNNSIPDESLGSRCIP